MKCAGSPLVLDITKYHLHSDGKMQLSKEAMEVVEWAIGVTGRKHLHTVLPLLKVYVTPCKKTSEFLLAVYLQLIYLQKKKKQEHIPHIEYVPAYHFMVFATKNYLSSINLRRPLT